VQSPPEESSYDLYVMNADGSGLEEIPIDGLSVASGVSWSPDGTRLALTSNAPDGTGLNVYVVNADGSGLERVLGGLWGEIAWSPDGRMFALAGYPDASTKPPDLRDIYTVAADGSGLTRISHAGTEVWLGSPAWSPDGKRIAFTRWDAVTGSLDIYVMNADGTGRTQLTDWKGIDTAPIWSPDGDWIAFASDRGATDAQIERNREGGNGEVGENIWIMRADGTDARQITAHDGNPFPSSWRAQAG
jgi:Tol biopolymer transport system component